MIGQAVTAPPLDIVFLVYEGITPLDLAGPFDVFGRLPGAKIRMVGPTQGLQRTTSGTLALQADSSIDDVSSADILIIPGGPGSDVLAFDKRVTDWVRAIDKTTRFTVSVCTGAQILAVAGLLEGRKATTHWRAMEMIAEYGATPVTARVVEDGKLITSAGVSAGIDMALTLAARLGGEELARAIQLVLEYAPEPPFDSGRIEDASPALLELARNGLPKP